MHNFFHDYIWKNGRPHGKRALLREKIALEPRAYRLVSDPYGKRILIEKYFWGLFDSLSYDSHLLDFRKVKTMEEGMWGRELRFRSSEKEEYFLRDPNDGMVLREEIVYCDQRAVGGKLYSIHGIFLSQHTIFSVAQGARWNGVILYDTEKRPVFWKEYALDPTSGEFTDLLHEEWDMENAWRAS